MYIVLSYAHEAKTEKQLKVRLQCLALSCWHTPYCTVWKIGRASTQCNRDDVKILDPVFHLQEQLQSLFQKHHCALLYVSFHPIGVILQQKIAFGSDIPKSMPPGKLSEGVVAF